MHINYVPNEYESMLVAAGWVDAASLDTEYGEYLRYRDDPLEYQRWLSLRNDWDDLNAEYKTQIEPFYSEYSESNMDSDTRQLEKNLLRQMADIEFMLGY